MKTDSSADIKRIDVTVVVAAFNVESFLRACLDSVTAQADVNIETICVDDGSTDTTPAILSEYAAKDPRIRIIRHERNKGLLGVRKTGALSARGRYIMFVDGDDILAPGACSKAFSAINGKKTDIAVFGVDIYSDGETDECYRNHFKLDIGDVEGDDYPVLNACFVKHRFPWNLWNKIYATDIARAAARFLSDDNLTMAEDMYYFFIIASMCKTATIISDKLYRYRIGSGVSTVTEFTEHLFDKRCRAIICLRHIYDYAKTLQPSPVIDKSLDFCLGKINEIILVVFSGSMPEKEYGKYLTRLEKASGDLFEPIHRKLTLALIPLAKDRNRVFDEWKKMNAEARRCLKAWAEADAEIKNLNKALAKAYTEIERVTKAWAETNAKADAEIKRVTKAWVEANAEVERVTKAWAETNAKADAEIKRVTKAWAEADAEVGRLNAELTRVTSMSIPQIARERLSNSLSKIFKRSSK